MKLFTIGFTKKNAEEFFGILKRNDIKRVVDIRLNNNSQLAAFTKKDDLSYFLKVINNIGYIHLPQLAPTEKLLKAYQKKEVDWHQYEQEYISILEERNIFKIFGSRLMDRDCFLCSEPTPEHCHRRLLAEYLRSHNKNIRIIHLQQKWNGR